MYNQRLSLTIQPGADPEKLIDALYPLLGAYRHNGQTLGQNDTPYSSRQRLTVMLLTPEQQSLAVRFNNQYVNQALDNLQQLSDAAPSISCAGPVPGQASACACRKTRFYIMFTHFLTAAPPVRCGDCYGPVPLYRLPAVDGDGYGTIISWEASYQACDTLQMHNAVGERWALNQMQNPHSALSRQGRAVSHRVESLTGIPTYYYLHDYRLVRPNQPTKPCPGCGGDWLLTEPLHDFFAFQCIRCRLLSRWSPNVHHVAD